MGNRTDVAEGAVEGRLSACPKCPLQGQQRQAGCRSASGPARDLALLPLGAEEGEGPTPTQTFTTRSLPDSAQSAPWLPPIKLIRFSLEGERGGEPASWKDERPAAVTEDVEQKRVQLQSFRSCFTSLVPGGRLIISVILSQTQPSPSRKSSRSETGVCVWWPGCHLGSCGPCGDAVLSWYPKQRGLGITVRSQVCV